MEIKHTKSYNYIIIVTIGIQKMQISANKSVHTIVTVFIFENYQITHILKSIPIEAVMKTNRTISNSNIHRWKLLDRYNL